MMGTDLSDVSEGEEACLMLIELDDPLPGTSKDAEGNFSCKRY